MKIDGKKVEKLVITDFTYNRLIKVLFEDGSEREEGYIFSKPHVKGTIPSFSGKTFHDTGNAWPNRGGDVNLEVLVQAAREEGIFEYSKKDSEKGVLMENFGLGVK